MEETKDNTISNPTEEIAIDDRLIQSFNDRYSNTNAMILEFLISAIKLGSSVYDLLSNTCNDEISNYIDELDAKGALQELTELSEFELEVYLDSLDYLLELDIDISITAKGMKESVNINRTVLYRDTAPPIAFVQDKNGFWNSPPKDRR